MRRSRVDRKLDAVLGTPSERAARSARNLAAATAAEELSRLLKSPEFSMARWDARIAAGLCGDCGAPRGGEVLTCRPCFHRHYCLGSLHATCVCPSVTS